jgi:hypothetical protein
MIGLAELRETNAPNSRRNRFYNVADAFSAYKPRRMLHFAWNAHRG